MEFGVLLLSLLIILVGAEAFTNSLEHVGERLKISEGVTGSIFAAVGTALPETMVPIIAIFSTAGTAEIRADVGMGAILGAPLMLSTLTLFLMALFAARRRGFNGELHPERTGVRRDLTWFLFAFGIGTAAIFLPTEPRLLRVLIALSLVVIYFIYLLLTIRASAKLVADGHGTEADHPLYATRLKLPLNMPVILLQLAVGFGCIVLGAGAVAVDHSRGDRTAGKGQQHSLDSSSTRYASLRQHHRRNGVSGQSASRHWHRVDALGGASGDTGRHGADTVGQCVSPLYVASRCAPSLASRIQRSLLSRLLCERDALSSWRRIDSTYHAIGRFHFRSLSAFAIVAALLL